MISASDNSIQLKLTILFNNYEKEALLEVDCRFAKYLKLHKTKPYNMHKTAPNGNLNDVMDVFPYSTRFNFTC